MEIINYSENAIYSGQKNRFRFTGNRINQSRYSSAAIVMPRNYGARNFVLSVKSAFSAFFKIFLTICKFIWIVPAVAACIYYPWKSVEKMAHEKSFALPVELDADNERSFAYLDEAIASFARETTTYLDDQGNVVDEDGNLLLNDAVLGGFKAEIRYGWHTMKKGEKIATVCANNNITLSTLLAANPTIIDVTEVPAGMKVKIPSMNGIIYTVSSGDSLSRIAKKYNVSQVDIEDVNNLVSANLEKGQQLFIPGAKLSESVIEKAMGEKFISPLKAKWYATSAYGSRIDPISKVRKNHTGVDMACPTGTPIYAAMSGTVSTSGWSNVYGYYVIIKHKDNYQTLYGHMSKIIAQKGAKVSQGEKIGLVGSTGYSTGPHLHFTVYKNGALVNPVSVVSALKGRF